MKHIKDNIRKIGSGHAQAWKTDDPNIITLLRTDGEDIHLDILEANIRHLEDEIKRAEPIPYPAGATEDMKRKIDEVNGTQGISRERLMAQKDTYIAIWEQVTEQKWL